ncbi:hypothetical protein [Nocardia jiangxiensis]|uniref:hypothetical protein n=1 Tax=Nocardia jiangxiensis TaxID=282685 RepID=UPI0002EBEB17|nr:hypothetical protein [Nocardia jiangxiensis]
MTRNWPELIYIMQYILDHPKEWDQTVYSNTCGTAYCFAGHTAIHIGGRQIRRREFSATDWLFREDDDYTDLVIPPADIAERLVQRFEGRFAPNSCIADGTTVWEMDCVAEAALGLTSDEADELFDSDNTIPQLIWYLRKWAEEDGVALPDSWPEPNEPGSCCDCCDDY